MPRRASITAPQKRIKKQQKISLSLRCQFSSIPARWTVGQNGYLVYSPALVGIIEVDPWALRQKFASLQQNQDSLLNFLNEVGSWDVTPSLSPRDYWEWQDILSAVLSNPGNWKQSASAIDSAKAHRLSYIPNHRLLFQPEGEFRSAIFSCSNHSALDAIIASIRFDEARLLRRRPSVRPIKPKKNKAVKTSRAPRLQKGKKK